MVAPTAPSVRPRPGPALSDPASPGYADPVVGLAAVQRAVRRLRRSRVLVYDADELVPRRLSRAEALEMLEGFRHQMSLVVVTSRLRGSDLVIRTLEWLGDRNAPSRPSPP